MPSAHHNQPILTLHWLEESRSQRIVWLFEELGLQYNLQLYHRQSTKEAESSIYKSSTLGKAPVLEIEYPEQDIPNKTIFESGFIIQYVIDNFDYEHKLSSLTPEEKEKVQFYLHFTEASLQPLLTFITIHDVAVNKSPFLAKPVTTVFAQKLDTLYCLKNVNLMCEYLEGELKQNYSNNTSSSQDLFFVSNKISGADIILMFPLEIIFEGSKIQQLGFDVTKFPLLAKWVSEIKSRTSFKKSYERVEKDGKGAFKISPITKNNS